MAICFLRALKTPCTSSTSVVGVSKTTSLGCHGLQGHGRAASPVDDSLDGLTLRGRGQK